MKCPKCGGKMKLNDKDVHSDNADSFEALRIYKCSDCGYLVQTSEISTAHNISWSTLR